MSGSGPAGGAASHAAGRRGFPALLEALRAPLLLSPAADVLAGWALTLGVASTTVPLRLLPTALGACCLLAAGMAQNALVDHEDDRRRKPERPLPRGAVSETAVQAAWALLSLAGLALLAGGWTLALGGGIVGGTWLYHAALKDHRVPGCVLLGLLRATSMGLGVTAAVAAGGADLDVGLFGCALYGLYIFGASLHASTDDEHGSGEASSKASRAGLGIATGVLGLWTLFAGIRVVTGDWQAGAGLGLLIWALTRLVAARSKLPAPAVTGVALSGLHILHGGTTFLVGDFVLGGVILALFGVSRLALRVYPPS